MTGIPCPWCVRVTCNHDVIRSGARSWRCRWSGYRPKDMNGRRRNCPWCWSTGAFTYQPVHHKLSHICVHKPKGSS